MNVELLKEINAAYYRLETKHAEITHALFHRIFELESGWYNENIRTCDEKEIGFSFIFPFDVEGKQIFEFVKLLRREEFYY